MNGSVGILGALVSFCALLSGAAALQDGTKVDRCAFPGLSVALVNGNIMCHGLVVENKFIMPSDCEKFLKAANKEIDTPITTEKTTWTIKKGTLIAASQNGHSVVDLTKFPITSTKPDDCFQEGQLFEGNHKLKPKTCVVVGYGQTTGSGSVAYDPANAMSAPITKSTSASCCKTVENTGLLKYSTFMEGHHVNCLVTTGKTCGIGDLGSPVMCDTESGHRVTIALTAAPACDKDTMFLAHDLTKRSDAVKFGDFDN